MGFGRARSAVVWTGAGALVAGAFGVLHAPAAAAATAAVGASKVTEIGTSGATLSAPVNAGGVPTTVSATCTGGPFTASSATVTGSATTTRSVALSGLSGFGKYVCAVTATQADKPEVVGQSKAAFYTTAVPTPTTLYVDGNPGPLGGGTRTTGCTGPGAEACSTIQQAVTAAQSLSNRAVTIHVQALTAVGPEAAYTEAVTIALPDTVRLTIRGTGNPIVRGLLGKSVFTISGPTGLSGSAPRVRLDSLTIAGGEATGSSGGGVTVAGDLVWLVNNTITENRGNTGAGVYNNSTNQLTLINNTITGNVPGIGSTGVGLAVFTLQGSTLLLNNTLADNPPSGSGTGLDVGSQGFYRLLNSILLRTTCGNPKAGSDGGHNVESGNTCGLNTTTNRVNNSGISLATTLAANGSTGPRTLAIGPDSSAHNWVPVDDCTVTFDARGFARPGIAGQNCDAGSFELQAPATAPQIGGTTASAVTDTTATLAAPVNPGGAPTSLGVTCTGGPYSWTSTSPGSGRSVVAATANLSGLTPGTEYTCALSASNSAGSANSSSAATFTTAASGSTPSPTPAPPTPAPPTPAPPTPAPPTPAPPTPAPAAGAPAVGTTSVAAIGQDTATLSAPVSPNGAPTSATATCSGGVWTAGGSFAGSGTAPVTVSVALTGLRAGTIYTCAVQATNTIGTTTSGTPVTFTTAAAPKPPTKITVKAKSFQAKKGKSATYTVATFTDAADLPAKSYRVTITWGDGTSSKGVVTRTGKGTYKVTGKHTYKTSGKKATKVTVAKAGTAAVSAKGRATSG